MTRVTGRFAAVDGFPTEGTITARNTKLRPGGGFTITGERRQARIRGGEFVFEDLQPGPVRFTIAGNGDTQEVSVTVPSKDEARFLELIEEVYDYEPEQVSAVLAAAHAAERSAESARKAADRVGSAEAVQSARKQAEVSAHLAAESADEASLHAATAQDAGSAAAESANAAARSAQSSKDDASRVEQGAGRAERAADDAESASATAVSVSSTAVSAKDGAVAANASAQDAAARAVDSAAAANSDADRAETAAEAASSIAGGEFAPLSHGHQIKDVSGLQQRLDEKLNRDEVSPNAQPEGGKVPRRSVSGDVQVPEIPGHALYAASKQYVDGVAGSKMSAGDASVEPKSNSVARRDASGALRALHREGEEFVVNNKALEDEFDRRLTPVSKGVDPGTLALRDSGGRLSASSPTAAAHVVTKQHLDQRIGARPAFFTGDGPPPSQIPGAAAGDVWLDARGNKLYRIEGV